MRRVSRVDANQAAIVRALQCMGFSVQHLHRVGQGCPDLLLGYRGKIHLAEIKDGDKPPSAQKLTEPQKQWFDAWRGEPPVILRSVDEAIEWARGLE